MEFEQMIRIIETVSNSSLTAFHYEANGVKIDMEREAVAAPAGVSPVAAGNVTAGAAAALPAAGTAAAAETTVPAGVSAPAVTPAAVSAAEKTAAPPAVDTAGAEMVQRSLDAIQNVEPHAGRRLNLDAEMAERMQQQFGIRMDQVELRESSQAADMDARAFAKGNVVQFAPGQFRPDTEQGRHLIEHELSHVAQQARGGIHADVPGLNVNADEGL